jgi:hypothetical protein
VTSPPALPYAGKITLVPATGCAALGPFMIFSQGSGARETAIIHRLDAPRGLLPSQVDIRSARNRYQPERWPRPLRGR